MRSPVRFWVSAPSLKPDLSGDNSIVVPPDPIPNSVVKRNSADDSVGSPHVKVGHSQTPNISQREQVARNLDCGLFCVCHLNERSSSLWKQVMWSIFPCKSRLLLGAKDLSKRASSPQCRLRVFCVCHLNERSSSLWKQVMWTIFPCKSRLLLGAKDLSKRASSTQRRLCFLFFI